MKDVTQQRRQQAAWWLAIRGLVRRATISATAEAFRWCVKGFVDDEDNEETDDAEVFQQVGFASRPKSSSNAEVIIVNVGADADHPVIIACRDEDTRRAFLAGANALLENESVMYNDSAQVRVKADGTVEVDDGAGGAVELATKADMDAAKVAYDLHTHVYSPGPSPAAATAVPIPLLPVPAGTTILKGK